MPYVFRNWSAYGTEGTVGFYAGNEAESASLLLINKEDALGRSLAGWFEHLADSTNTPKGQFIIQGVSDPTKIQIFDVEGEAANLGSGFYWPIVWVAGTEDFAEEEEVSVSFARTGDKGDTGSGSLDYKDSTRVSTTGNVTISSALNSGDVVDGITLASGDRVLVANQSTKSQNGIYVAGSSPARASDANGAGELSGGTHVNVEQGAKYGGREMRITTAGSITPGSTAHEWAPLNPKDHGVVTTLPTSAALVGDTCTYAAEKASGVLWELVYDGEGTYPWKKVGGPPLYEEVETEQGTSSSSYTNLGTFGPSLTAPLKGDYDIAIGYYGKSKDGATADRMSYSIGGSSADDMDAAVTVAQAGQGGATVSRLRRKTGLAASTVLTAKYKVGGGTEGAFMFRWMSVDPVRVG